MRTTLEKRLGKRAAEYVVEHSISTLGGRVRLVADEYETPKGVARTLSRVLGTPYTLDRGEVAYWDVPQDWF